MAITDPFTITHQGKQRKIDVQSMTFETPTDGDIGLFANALTWIDGGTGIDASRTALKKAAEGTRFSQTEIVTAFQSKATAMGLSLSNEQIGELITGGVEQAIRTRFED